MEKVRLAAIAVVDSDFQDVNNCHRRGYPIACRVQCTQLSVATKARCTLLAVDSAAPNNPHVPFISNLICHIYPIEI
jgi:hypothetical protein